MPGQQQMHLHFCVKPNKIWTITVRRQLLCLTYSLQSSTSQRKKKKESGKIHVRMNIGYEEIGYSLKYKKQTDIETR